MGQQGHDQGKSGQQVVKWAGSHPGRQSWRAPQNLRPQLSGCKSRWVRRVVWYTHRTHLLSTKWMQPGCLAI